MGSESPEYESHQYIADHERQAYVDAGGVQAHQLAQSGMPGSVVGSFQRTVAQAQAKVSAGQYGQQQAQELSQGHQLWGKPSALGSTHYRSFPHKELHRFVNENFEPGSVHEMGRIYHDQGKELIELAERIHNAAMRTRETWRGEAGDAMRTHVTGVAEHMGYSGEAAQLTANQIGMQAESGEQARNAMPEVPDFDMQAELRELALNPNPFTVVQRANEIRAKAEDAEAKHQEAAHVVTTMEGGFGTAATSTPKFTPPPTPPGDTGDPGQPTTGRDGRPVGDVGSPSRDSGPSSTSSASVTPSSTATPSSVGSTSSGSYTSSPGSQPSGTQSPAGTSSAWTSNSSSPPSGTVRGPDGTLYRQDPRTGQWLRQNSANGRWAPVPPGQQVPGVGGGRSGSVSGGGAGGRPGGGFGPRGSVPGQSSSPSGQSLSPGGRSGVAPPGSPSPSTPSASTPGTSSSGRGGRMPMGGAGSGNQQGGEDEEHENKYVLETDEVWEDLGIPAVAPKVIGAAPWEKEG